LTLPAWRDWFRRFRRTPEPPQPTYTAQQIIDARDAQWHALIERYDAGRQANDAPRAFSPLLIDNEQRKCFRMREVNGVRMRMPVPCEGDDGG
jgi:hypothetical protein